MCNLQAEKLQVVTEQNFSYPSHKTKFHAPLWSQNKTSVPLVTKLNLTHPFNLPLQSQNKTSSTPLCKNKSQVPRVLKCKNPHTSRPKDGTSRTPWPQEWNFNNLRPQHETSRTLDNKTKTTYPFQ